MGGRYRLALASTIACMAACPHSSEGGQARLSGAKAVRCSFSRAVSSSWKGQGAPDAAIKATTLVLRFEAIDIDSGTAQLKTGAVASEVTVRSVEGYLHFMQAFRTGPLYTTTVFGAGPIAGRYKAVHSRHEYFSTPLPGATSSPEQYYGECELG